MDLSNSSMFLILACDGLWDKMSYQESVDFVYNSHKAGKNLNEISNLLVAEALSKGSMDNVTVVIVMLNWF